MEVWKCLMIGIRLKSWIVHLPLSSVTHLYPRCPPLPTISWAHWIRSMCRWKVSEIYSVVLIGKRHVVLITWVGALLGSVLRSSLYLSHSSATCRSTRVSFLIFGNVQTLSLFIRKARRVHLRTTVQCRWCPFLARFWNVLFLLRCSAMSDPWSLRGSTASCRAGHAPLTSVRCCMKPGATYPLVPRQTLYMLQWVREISDFANPLIAPVITEISVRY